MQQPQGDDLTGPEVGFGVFGDGAQLLIDLVEQRRDQIHCGHGLLRSSPGCMLSTSVEEVHAHDNKASKYYLFIGLQATNTIGFIGTSTMCKIIVKVPCRRQGASMTEWGATSPVHTRGMDSAHAEFVICD